MSSKNASIHFFNDLNETEALADVYSEVYKLSLDYPNMSIIFVNLKENYYDTLTLHDLSVKVNYWTYSEYGDYSLDELEDQISLLYNDFYKPGAEWEPLVLIIHDATNMSDCGDFELLLEYLEDKVTLLEVLKLYIYCTVKNI